MKRILFICLIAIGCSKKEDPKEIALVENSLFNNVHFEDDSLWSISDRMKFYGVPGVSIAVIKDSKIAWLKAYGIMDKETNEPVTTTTLFQAGSISKPVAAYGALKTVETGKIDLNTDVNTYLTSWKLPDNEFTKEKKVTLEHLVSHTGGLTVHGFLGYSPDLPVPTLIQVLDGTPPANSGPIRVDKAPGTGFRYSGGGYTVMQQMMIDVYGKPFPEIEQELVLGPLGMSNSTYDNPLDAEKIRKAATGYLPNHEQTKGKRHTYPEMAAAGLWTTAEDLAKFAIDVQQTLKGESSKVLSKEMVAKMTTPVKNEKSIGLGLFMNDKDGDVYFGHGGWDEGFSSELLAHKEKGYGVVVLTNSNHPQFIRELMNSVARVYNWGNFVKEYKRIEDDPTIAGDVTGRYENGTDGRITITNENEKLFFQFIRWGKPERLYRISDNTYLIGYSNRKVEFKSLADGNLDLVISNDANHDGSHLKLTDDKKKIPYEYFLEGDHKRALEEYKKILKSSPEDEAVTDEAMINSAEALYNQGKSDLAIEMLKIAQAVHPESERVKATIAELENISK